MKRALVTGGGGFIGSHIVKKLLQQGVDVTVVDNLSSTNGVILPNRLCKNVLYILEDIRHADALKKLFLEVKPEVVFHTAALARIQPSIINPEEYCAVNVQGTLNILLASRDSDVRRVVYSASSSAYGKNPIPSCEDMTPDPLNPYAATKLMGEHWMKVFAEPYYGIQTASLRYFNVYGPGNVYNGPYTTVITLFLHWFAKGEPMQIVGDGKQTRDYTHVFDVVQANLLAAESKNVGGGEVINIGCGVRHSVIKIAEHIGNAPIDELIKNGKAMFVPPRKGESRNTRSSIVKAKKLLGWAPEISFDDGLETLNLF